MMDNHSDLCSRLDRLIHELVRLYNTKLDVTNRYRELDKLSTIELGILNLLEWERHMPLREIARSLNTPNSTLTSAVDRLEKKELCRRDIDPEDRRTFRLIPTAKGKKVIELRKKLKKELLETIFAAFDTDEEREQLVRLLEKLSTNLDASEN